MNRLTNTVPGGAKVEMASSSAKNEGSPILDRSRAQLRLPTDLVSETLRIAHVQSMPNVDPDSAPEPPARGTIERLEKGGVLVAGVLDPIAFELLDVINQASLVVAVDLHCMDDSSVPTVWATPRQAVVSGTLDPAYIEFRPVAVSQLPQVLGELIVLRSPRFVGDIPISINSQILNKARGLTDDREEALQVLTGGGLDPDQAVLALDIQRPDVRRWRISSTWSTDEGQQTTELRGLDAGLSGHWLIGSTTANDQVGQLTFTPQGHGEVMSAFRHVLPKNWMGTPLNRPGTETT